ncbi:MAG: 3-oxoacyl-ACP reductase FabG [Acidobacteria bacterium]|nr:3-oxoacyl-ACP reductase FabG [Acidobacteriota bacterium]
MVDLTGKIAVVTGGARGIGQTIAAVLAGCGAHVVAADVMAAGASGAAATGGAGAVETAVMDVTDAAGVEATIADVMARHGRVDILVNNAGITRDQLLMRMKRDDWDRVLNVNLTGAFICSQAVLRPMMKQRAGRIISISSVVGQMGNAGQSNYAASKAGLIGFSKALAREVASRNITVNVVAPGLIDTEMTRALPPETQNEWLGKVPLGRFGSPEDIASAVCFLASNEASYITGQVLAVNGGMYT